MIEIFKFQKKERKFKGNLYLELTKKRFFVASRRATNNTMKFLHAILQQWIRVNCGECLDFFFFSCIFLRGAQVARKTDFNLRHKYALTGSHPRKRQLKPRAEHVTDNNFVTIADNLDRRTKLMSIVSKITFLIIKKSLSCYNYTMIKMKKINTKMLRRYIDQDTILEKLRYKNSSVYIESQRVKILQLAKSLDR